MKAMKLQNILTSTYLMLLSTLSHANAIDELNRSAEDITKSIGILGLIVTGMAIGAGELLKNEFIQHFVHRYKLAVTSVVSLFAVCAALSSWIVKIGEWLAHPFTQGL